MRPASQLLLLLLAAVCALARGDPTLNAKFAGLFKKRVSPCYEGKNSFEYIRCMAGSTIDGVEALVQYPELKAVLSANPTLQEDFDTVIAGLNEGRKKCGTETTTKGLSDCINTQIDKMQKDAARKKDKILDGLISSIDRWWHDVQGCSKDKKKFQTCTEKAVDVLFA